MDRSVSYPYALTYHFVIIMFAKVIKLYLCQAFKAKINLFCVFLPCNCDFKKIVYFIQMTVSGYNTHIIVHVLHTSVNECQEDMPVCQPPLLKKGTISVNPVCLYIVQQLNALLSTPLKTSSVGRWERFFLPFSVKLMLFLQ